MDYSPISSEHDISPVSEFDRLMDGFPPSVLFLNPAPGANRLSKETPSFFVDLNLDQVIEAIVAGKPEYNLKPYFYSPLRDIDEIHYRQEVMRDLENAPLLNRIRDFGQKMRSLREQSTRASKLSPWLKG